MADRGKSVVDAGVRLYGSYEGFRDEMKRRRSMGSQPVVSKEELAGWLDKGLTQAEVAAQLNTTQPNISRLKRKYGL